MTKMIVTLILILGMVLLLTSMVQATLSPDNTLMYYEFDDLNDGDGNYQSNLNYVDGSPSYVTGVLGDAVYVEDTEYMQNLTLAPIIAENVSTIDGWIYFKSFLNYPAQEFNVLYKDGGDAVYTELRGGQNNGDMNIRNYNNTFQWLHTNFTFNVTTWYHVVLTVGTNGTWVYVNGVPVDYNNSVTRTSEADNIRFGENNQEQSYHIDAYLDNWRYSSSQYTDKDVEVSYSNGAGFNFTDNFTTTKAEISFTNTTNWYFSGDDTDTFSRTFVINNTGTYNATSCDFNATGTLQTYLTTNSSDFVVEPNNNKTAVEVTFTNVEASNYNTSNFVLQTTCVGDSNNNTYTTTTVKLDFVISASTPLGISQPTGGGGGTAFDNRTIILDFGVPSFSFTIIAPPVEISKELLIKNVGEKDIEFAGTQFTEDIKDYVTVEFCDIDKVSCKETLNLVNGESGIMVLKADITEDFGEGEEGFLKVITETETFELPIGLERLPAYKIVDPIIYFVENNLGLNRKASISTVFIGLMGLIVLIGFATLGK